MTYINIYTTIETKKMIKGGIFGEWYNSNESIIQCIKNKFKHLMIPYFTFSLIYLGSIINSVGEENH